MHGTFKRIRNFHLEHIFYCALQKNVFQNGTKLNDLSRGSSVDIVVLGLELLPHLEFHSCLKYVKKCATLKHLKCI